MELYLYAKNEVRRSRPSKVRARTAGHTHTQTDRQTDRQTHATENITFPLSRLVIMIIIITIKMPSVEGSPTAGVCILWHSKVIG